MTGVSSDPMNECLKLIERMKVKMNTLPREVDEQVLPVMQYCADPPINSAVDCTGSRPSYALCIEHPSW